MAWRRSDITTIQVLEACREHQAGSHKIQRPFRYYLLEKTGAPLKVVLAAIEREYAHGFVVGGLGLLTEAGNAFLEKETSCH